MFFRFTALLCTLLLPSGAYAAQSDAALRSGLQSDVQKYLSSRAKPEHISGVSLSVSLPGNPANINVVAGRFQYGGKGSAIAPATLYQIGSVTKSFTAAAILQLEAEGKLNIGDTVGKWLPQYPSWRTVTIRRLLNMTSMIPTYDGVPAMLRAYAADPMKHWTAKQLVAFVYPDRKPDPGWLYSNTAYLLSQMIIERASGNSYSAEIHRRFLDNPAIGFTSTYYETNTYPPPILDRMISGYFFSTDPDNKELAPLLGKDVKNFSISWTQGAGGIVSTPQDVTRWCRALYEGSILKAKQRAELETLVSMKTGLPIPNTSANDARSFGLGVGEMYVPKMGRVWFYEGMTLGYRMAYVYVPKSNVVFAVGLNSQPDSKQDKVGELLTTVYSRLRAAGKV